MDGCCGCFNSTKNQKKKKDRAIKEGTYPANRVLKKQENPRQASYLQNVQPQDQYVSAAQVQLPNTRLQTIVSADPYFKQRAVTLNSMRNNYAETKESKLGQQRVNTQLITGSQVPSRRAESYLDHNAYNFPNSQRSGDRSIIPAGSVGQGAPINMQLLSSPMCACKTYKFMCMRCSKIFNKILVIDLSQYSDKDLTIFDIQELFSQSQNHECECPFCLEVSHLILTMNMVLGTLDQIETIDLNVGAGAQQQLAESEFDEQRYLPSLQGQGTQFEKSMTDVNQAIKACPGGEHDENTSSRHSIRPASIKTISKILKHRVQKLRDPEKTAQVYIMGEIQKSGTRIGTTRASDEQVQSEIGGNSTKYAPLEYNMNKPEREGYQQYNKDVMRSIIGGKMKKNRTFLELKIFPNNMNSLKGNVATDQRVLQYNAINTNQLAHQNR